MSLLRRLFLLVLLAIMPILAVEITNKVYLFDDRVITCLTSALGAY